MIPPKIGQNISRKRILYEDYYQYYILIYDSTVVSPLVGVFTTLQVG